MKKLFALLLALVMLALTACELDSDTVDGILDQVGDAIGQLGSQGGQDNIEDNVDDPSVQGSGSVEDIDFGAIFSGNTGSSTVWGLQDEATKQTIIAAGKESGIDISFSADGSMTMYDTNTGETMVQKPDGSWVFKDENGGEAQLGSSWPDNEFTKLIPKPSFEIIAAVSDGNEFAAYASATLDQLKAYAEEVKAAGFTVDADTQNLEYGGVVIYTYTAKNAQGYTVTLSYTGDAVGIAVSKP